MAAFTFRSWVLFFGDAAGDPPDRSGLRGRRSQVRPEARIEAIEILADFRSEPEKIVSARLREIAGVFARAAAKLGG